VSSSDQSAKNVESQAPREAVEWDRRRSFEWFITGAVIHGPYFFLGYGKVDKLFGPAITMGIVMKKTIFSQFVMFPPYLLSLFAWLSILEGQSAREAIDVACEKFPKAFYMGCLFWPIANTLNFRLVGPATRVPFTATAGIIWNAILSTYNASYAVLEE